MKKENIKNKLKGILIILIGLVLAAVGVWLYSKVWGINLLFTDSSLGKVARFYWIFLIAAVIVVALGIRKFRKRVIVEQETENNAQSNEPGVQNVESSVQNDEAGAQNNESFNAEVKETEASKEKAGEQPDKQPTVQSDKQPGKEVTAKETAGETKAGATEAQPESVKEEKSAKKSFMKKKAGNTCPNCNKPIGKGNKFCTSCGYKLV